MVDPFIDAIIETIIDEAIIELRKKKAYKILFNYKICSYVFSKMSSSNKYLELAKMMWIETNLSEYEYKLLSKKEANEFVKRKGGNCM